MQDLIFIIQWWFTLFILGAIFLPLTSLIFSNFYDKGYIFSKTLGVALLAYTIFVFGVLKILPFTQIAIFVILTVFLLINFLVVKRNHHNFFPDLASRAKIIIFEEILFLSVLAFWSYIKTHEPNIYGLEKFMDFGFINSALRSTYFPPTDMWYPPLPINYYYFGHVSTAVITKLSGITSSVSYNLMIATLCAFSFTGAFSIVLNLINRFMNDAISKIYRTAVVAGLLGGILVTFSGNLHTIHSFFSPYPNPENPVPFWTLPFQPSNFPNGYWYPNATRYIPFTIHEFPIYSFVVSDLHGHVIDIPFVLLTIAVLFSLFLKSQITNHKSQINPNVQNSKRFEILNFNILKLFRIWNFEFGIFLLISFLLAVMYMTNAWDGMIYFLLTALVLTIIHLQHKWHNNVTSQDQRPIYHLLFPIFLVGFGFFLFTLPFSLHFKPFVSGIGVLCAPEFLVKLQKVGPFLFEANHCAKSPLWQLLILYGFFYFFVISFIIFIFKHREKIQNSKSKVQSASWRTKFKVFNSKLFTFNFSLLTSSDVFILILIFLSTLLIILPEFIYMKDIYPAHYRANTMFKLGYQAFIMLSLSSAYIIVRIISSIKRRMSNISSLLFFIFSILFFILVMIYPYFAIYSYFGDLKTYYGLDGFHYLKTQQPSDYEAVLWINKNISGQPVIIEAQGDSYTMYGRISANTGLPTIIGWGVHEWLWRGTYDIVSPRIEEVKTIYESEDVAQTKLLLTKYNVSYVYIGRLEHEKYPLLNELKFNQLGEIIYQNPGVKIYKIRS